MLYFPSHLRLTYESMSQTLQFWNGGAYKPAGKIASPRGDSRGARANGKASPPLLQRGKGPRNALRHRRAAAACREYLRIPITYAFLIWFFTKSLQKTFISLFMTIIYYIFTFVQYFKQIFLNNLVWMSYTWIKLERRWCKMLCDLGERLQILRKQKRISQEQLAKRAGLSRSSISAYEKGMTIPSAEVIYELCVILDTTSDYLLGLDNIRKISVEGLSQRQIDIMVEMAGAFKSKNG